MKRNAFYLLLAVSVCCFYRCSKGPKNAALKIDNNPTPVITDFNKSDTINGTITITGHNFSKVASQNIVTFNTSKSTAASELDSLGVSSLTVRVPQGATTGKLTLQVLTKSVATTDTFTVIKNSWIEMRNSPGGPRQRAIGFSIGNNGYIGLGLVSYLQPNSYYNDLWQYDPGSDMWTQKASFPGTGTKDAFSIVLNNNVYVGGGTTPSGAVDPNLYMYDQQTNKWSLINSSIPSGGVGNILGFSYNSLLYIFDSALLWRYDTQANKWSRVSSFPGVRRSQGFLFIIGSTLYFGKGVDSGYHDLYDFWQYDLNANIWTQKNNLNKEVGSKPVAFTINNLGYMGFGSSGNNFYIYYPATDTWKETWAFSNNTSLLGWGASFTINGKAYVITGYGNDTRVNPYAATTGTSINWQFTPYN